MPGAALVQMLREYHRSPLHAREQSMFRNALPTAFENARRRGELPDDIEPERLATLVKAIVLASCDDWSEGRTASLVADVRYATRVLFAGIQSAPTSPPQ